MGAKYTFNGSKLTEKYKSTVIANVRGDKICDRHTSTVVANVRNGYLCSKNSSSRICKMRDVHNEIEGPGEEIKAALWFLFVK